MFTFNCGDRARNRITKFTGIVTSRAEHLTGCNRYWLIPEELKDGKEIDGSWHDEDTMELVDAQVFKPIVRLGAVENEPAMPLRRTGGPSSQPSSQSRQNTK